LRTISFFFLLCSVAHNGAEEVPQDLNIESSSNVFDTSASINPYNWLNGAQNYAQNTNVETNPDLQASSSYSDPESDPFSAQESHGGRRKYRKKGSKRRRKGEKRRNKYKYNESESYDDDYYNDQGGNSDEYYYDRDDSYGAPKAPSYSAPSSEYSAPSDSYGAPSYSGGGGDGFNDFLNALAAFLPIGLFLAAIPPNLITITTKKKRSTLESNEVETEVEEYGHPFMKRISELGFDKLWMDAECQKQLLCQMTQKGRENNANNVQKSLNFASTMFPFFGGVANGRGGVMQEVFTTIQDGNSCEESFHCQ